VEGEARHLLVESVTADGEIHYIDRNGCAPVERSLRASGAASLVSIASAQSPASLFMDPAMKCPAYAPHALAE